MRTGFGIRHSVVRAALGAMLVSAGLSGFAGIALAQDAWHIYSAVDDGFSINVPGVVTMERSTVPSPQGPLPSDIYSSVLRDGRTLTVAVTNLGSESSSPHDALTAALHATSDSLHGTLTDVDWVEAKGVPGIRFHLATNQFHAVGRYFIRGHLLYSLIVSDPRLSGQDPLADDESRRILESFQALF